MRSCATLALILTMFAVSASTSAAFDVRFLVDPGSGVAFTEENDVIFVRPTATPLRLFVEVDSPRADLVDSVFSSVRFTGGVSFVSGTNLPRILSVGGFPSLALLVVEQPQLVGGEANRISALAYEKRWSGPTFGTGPEISSLLVFDVSGPGSITHFAAPDDVSVINGAPATLNFVNRVVIVPEPGTALLTGLGLVGLALGRGRRH